MENSPALRDGFGSLSAGVNTQQNHAIQSAINPDGLERTQLAGAVNATLRGGLGATHRPPYMRRELLFESDPILAGFGPAGLWQGFSVHQSTQTTLVVAIGGRVFNVCPENNFRVSELTIPGDASADNLNYAWFLQAGPFTVIQDGEAKPLIFDGTSLRRSKPNEIKVGTAMGYSQGRIVYAVYDQYRRATRFRATDLIGNQPTAPGQPGGTARYQYQDSVLQETENTFLNEGGDFSARSEMGEIRAMVVPRMLDTSLGQGPLQVMCERGVLSFNAPVDRTQWKNVTYPIETESQLDYGPMGSRIASNVNGDVIYRSLEGFHSFKLARADFQTWLNTPISMEVDEIIQDDDEALLFYGSSVLFDSRYLATTMPRPTPGGVVHDGLVALDMNLIATLRKREAPAWEGLWTGLSILQVAKGSFNGVERCFMFVRTTEGRIELWELLPTNTTEIWDNATTPIVWSIETPGYDFGVTQDLKRLQTAAVWTSDVKETVEYLMQWRPDQHPCYLDWHAWSDCAPIKQCKLPRCGTPKNLRPQYRPKVRLPQPPDSCNGVNQSLYRDGFELQFRLQVTGHAKICKTLFAADPLPEPFFDGCPTARPCLPLDCCSPDPLIYSAAPYHNSGSSGGYSDYPVVLVYPGNYFAQDTTPPYPGCLECAVVNPPAVPLTPLTPGTVTFPGLPPVVLLPRRGTPDLTCDPIYFFAPTWPNISTSTGEVLGVGAIVEPPDGLQDGTLEAWATQTWQQFSAYIIANGLTVTAAQIVILFTGNTIGPPGYKRWFADLKFQQNVTIGSFGLGFELEVQYCLA